MQNAVDNETNKYKKRNPVGIADAQITLNQPYGR